MYELLGISLVLTTLLTINALASLVAAGCWRLMERPARQWTSRTRAEVLFAMRVGPPLVAVCSVAVFLIPSYLVYEPYSTNEFVSKKLAAMAAVSALGVVLAVTRGIRSWLATRSLLKRWLDGAVPTSLDGIAIPAFRISHSFPIIAVVGTLRPRLFVADRVLESLGKEELMAAIAHECGHLAARDNLKRVLMRVSRDTLAIVPCGRSIDRAWAENAEEAADEHAAARGPALALNLASALIEIARMVPAGARPTMPVGSSILGDETKGVMGRVRHLLELAAGNTNQSPAFSGLTTRAFKISSAVLVVTVMIILATSSVLASLHNAMEHVVQILN